MMLGAGFHVLCSTNMINEYVPQNLGHKISACVFALGAMGFSGMQLLQKYLGNDFVIRRLRRMQILGDIFFLVAAVLVIENSFLLAFPYFANSSSGTYAFYLQYIHNNWVVFLLMAVILEVYTTHRIDSLIKPK